ncbi:glycoside hydrolase family 61 protein-like protein [Clathrospora elynae]|uniref:AA9 family lytic polysaccharide monooxygenase n=1 Tax=Clathrospora elynae TaxID=706981 RepID=A0A6A5SG78_9PLEO|nr:glycoside hydrolase family 61 protein-like protein [Clathrospora elynae]
MWNILASIAGFLTHQACAHGGALNYTVGDTWYPGSISSIIVSIYPVHQSLNLNTILTSLSHDPFGDQILQDAAPWMVQRKCITNNPIFETTNTSLSCNTPGTPARSYIPIRAGENITAAYGYWVHTVGPMIVWMTYCSNPTNDCETFDSSTADWFKIGEKGLLDGDIQTGEWFQGQFSRWDSSPSLWSETVPGALRKGRNFVRHEIISLHSANKPQFYPECAHLDVSGDGEGFPTEEYLVRIPGVWSMDRESARDWVWVQDIADDYKIPGPSVWTGEIS